MADEKNQPIPEKEPKMQVKAQPSAATSDDDMSPSTRIMSAHVHNDIHTLLEKAQPVFELNKSQMVNLALLFFIDSCYMGNGQWKVSERIEDLSMGAVRAQRALRVLPPEKRS